MIEWTQRERQFFKDNGDEDITEVIDGFNSCSNVEQMLRYLLERPTGWSCERWQAIPISKFGDVMQTIHSAENNEVCKLRALVKELADKLHSGNYCGTCYDACTITDICRNAGTCALVARAREVAK